MVVGMVESSASEKKATVTLKQVLEKNLVSRPQLVEKLLEDRGVVRLIAAPHGFGKSTLAQEYAARLFQAEEVFWIDAGQPEFIQALDDGCLADPKQQDETFEPKLIVIDGLPYLDEERVQTLSGHIDLLLYQGVEVMVTALPSHDCLSFVQPDRLLVSAGELLVSRKELQDTAGCSCIRGIADSREDCLQEWERLSCVPFGLTPSYVWNDELSAQKEGLVGFFAEQLPVEMLRAAFCILLLGRGDFSDLACLGVDLHAESEQSLVRDYPFLGVDPLRRSFSVNGVVLDLVRDAVVEAQRTSMFSEGEYPLIERVLAMLFDRGDSKRGRDVLERFCAEDSYVIWLMNRGWDLLDRGEVEILDALFERCPDKTVHHNPELSALKAWYHGLYGDVSDTLHYASWACSVSQILECDSKESDLPGMMAYLALLAFDYQSEIENPRRSYAAAEVNTSVDLLASVVDACGEADLVRALNAALSGRDDCEFLQDGAYGHDTKALQDLLNQGADRFRSSLAYRIALHLATAVDSIELRALIKALGRAVIMPLRRSGIQRFSEALLVADMWRCGMFGVSGRVVAAKDACLLNDAAVMLKQLSSLAGFEMRGVPWEATAFSGAALPVARVSQDEFGLGSLVVQRERIPIANVRLFGCVEVTIGDEYIPESYWRRKSLQLFVLLVMYQGREVSREFLIDQLWPKANRQNGLDSYYTAWSNVAKTLGDGRYLERRNEFCRINHHYVSSDIGEFEQLVRRVLTKREDTAAMLEISTRIEALYRGGLMPGTGACESIAAQRDRCHSMFIDTMVTASVKALEVKDARMALWFAGKALEYDTQREDVYGALMSAQIASGQRCSAIRTYFKCCDFLREELGLDPSERVQGMYSSLIAADPSLLRLTPLQL